MEKKGNEIQKRVRTDIQKRVQNDTEKKETNILSSVVKPRFEKVVAPLVDILETFEHIILLIDMPGSDENSIDITLDKNQLTVEAAMQPLFPQGYELQHAEYEFGDYRRKFIIQEGINRETIEADYKNGVLRIKLPKTEEVKPRTIPIRKE
ncbi:MAG: Hsp20 family protein [Calditrichae bacterium]|nr:Hsp20 family protein [Calditrichia bacterium]